MNIPKIKCLPEQVGAAELQVPVVEEPSPVQVTGVSSDKPLPEVQTKVQELSYLLPSEQVGRVPSTGVVVISTGQVIAVRNE